MTATSTFTATPNHETKAQRGSTRSAWKTGAFAGVAAAAGTTAFAAIAEAAGVSLKVAGEAIPLPRFASHLSD